MRLATRLAMGVAFVALSVPAAFAQADPPESPSAADAPDQKGDVVVLGNVANADTPVDPATFGATFSSILTALSA